jgi:hypothetical protein
METGHKSQVTGYRSQDSKDRDRGSGNYNKVWLIYSTDKNVTFSSCRGKIIELFKNQKISIKGISEGQAGFSAYRLYTQPPGRDGPNFALVDFF